MHALKLRHRAELQELKKTAPKGKGGAKELRLKEKEIKERHEAEIEELRKSLEQAESGAGEAVAAAEGAPAAAVDEQKADHQPESDDDAEDAAPGALRKSKAQRRRERKEAREQAELEEASARRANLPDKRAEENQQLALQLAPLGLEVVQIKSDGHCMYNAVNDQLERRGGGGVPVPAGSSPLQALRKAVSEHMLANEDTFAAFFLGQGNQTPQEAFRAYCKSVAEEAVWGGEHELVSLAALLQRSLVVHQSGCAPTRFDPPSGPVEDKPALQLSYHKHQYSLGNHYNSLRDVEPVAAEA